MAGHATPATDLLTKQRIEHRVLSYRHDPKVESYGLEAAEALELPAEQVFKTLVAEVDGTLTVAVVPVAGQLDTKALATASGGKKARLAPAAQAERATGYVVGGIAPLGHRRRLPVVVDASALNYDAVYCSGGRRGLEIELRPADLVALTGATVAEIGTR